MRSSNTTATKPMEPAGSPARHSQFDILGIGCSTVDDLFFVDHYPEADAKVRAQSYERHCGGLTATALVAAAKLGARCAYGGVLGEDDLSRFIENNFQSHGVDLSTLIRQPCVRPIHAVIIVSNEDGSRTIFFEEPPNSTVDFLGPCESLIPKSKVVFVDYTGSARTLKAMQIARQAGVPCVCDFEQEADPLFPALLEHVDHLVLSDVFAKRLTGAASPADAVKALWSPFRKAVVVTCGEDGAWFSESETSSPRHQAAFRIKAIDTTGCGDVFHGAYACALAKGEPIEERMRYASAAAALAATKRGGQVGAPTADELSSFLREVES